MKADYRHLLKPDVLHSIKGLQLIARVIVDGYLSGLNHSSRVGAGMEFSQYRSYEPGDDLRLLDWKMLARSGRYYIKQSQIETNITVKFILDASNSMSYAEGELSKMDYTRVMIASMAYLAQHQGDAIGLFALNDQDTYSVYPRVQKQHFNRFLHQLVDIENKGTWPSANASTDILHDRRHKELIVFVTDLYEYQGELTEFIKSLKTGRNEVLVFHVHSHKERVLDYSGSRTFEDLETGRRIKAEVGDIRKEYERSLQLEIEVLKQNLLESNIAYEPFMLNTHIGEALNSFLKRRKFLI